MRIRILLSTVLMLVPTVAMAQPERLDRPRTEPRLAPVTRMYNDDLPDHLYTTDPREAEARRQEGYGSESVTWALAAEEQPGLVPLYRFVDPRSGGHMLSTNPRAQDTRWRREGALGYVATQRTPGMVALYGFIGPYGDRMFYTLDPNGELASDNGWEPVGIVCYVYRLRQPPPR